MFTTLEMHKQSENKPFLSTLKAALVSDMKESYINTIVLDPFNIGSKLVGALRRSNNIFQRLSFKRSLTVIHASILLYMKFYV